MGFLPQNAEGESREILSSMQYCKIIRYDKGKTQKHSFTRKYSEETVGAKAWGMEQDL